MTSRAYAQGYGLALALDGFGFEEKYKQIQRTKFSDDPSQNRLLRNQAVRELNKQRNEYNQANPPKPITTQVMWGRRPQ